MKICRMLYFFPPGGSWIGGWIISAYQLTKAQIKRGHEVEILAGRAEIYPRRETIENFRVERVPSLALPMFHLNLITYGVFSFLKIKNIKPDIVHGHDKDPAVYSLLKKSLKSKIPFFLHSHGLHSMWYKTGVMDLKKTTLEGKIENVLDYKARVFWDAIAHKNADFIFCASEAHKREIISEFKIDPEKIHVVYNGIEEKFFKPGKSNTREALGIEKDSKVILIPGSDSRKGFHIMLRAFKILERKYKKICLIVTSERERELRKIYGKLLSKNVKMIGLIPYEKMGEIYNAADVMVLPTLYETFGKTIIEAMACGTPVIASNVGGIPEVIDNGKNGILIPPKDHVTLAKKIMYLLDNPSVGKKLGKNARKKVLRNWTWDKVAERVDGGYKIFFENK